MVPKHLMAICSLAVGRTDHLSELASAVGVDSRLAKAVCVLSRAPTSDILRLTDLRDILTTLGVLEVDKVLSLVAIARRSLQHASRSIDTLQLGVSPHVLQSLMVAAMPLRLRHTWLQRAAGVYHGAGGGHSGVGHDRVAVQRVVTSVVAPLVASRSLDLRACLRATSMRRSLAPWDPPGCEKFDKTKSKMTKWMSMKLV